MEILKQVDFNFHFQKLYRILLEYFDKKTYSKVKQGKNIKAHQVYAFDLEVNDIIIKYFQKNMPIPAKIISEEGEEVIIGNTDPKYLIVIDPVDGSVNVKRGLNIFAGGIAILKGATYLSLDSVVAAMVGNFLTRELYTATKGAGAYCNGMPIQSSSECDPKNFCLSFELSHLQEHNLPHLFELTSQIHQVRSLGSAIAALSLVAKGALEAHIDVRDRLTIENILPPSLIITEAGGIISDRKGEKLKRTTNLKQGFNIIACGNETIQQWILKRLC
ncbi:MAG: inositol monophosphatase family protein [Candidatus Helarchaeota archaeon]